MNSYILRFFIVGFTLFPAFRKAYATDKPHNPNTIDTVRISSSGNYLYFSESVFGVSHLHFLGKDIKCIDPASFQTDDGIASKDRVDNSPEEILAALHGMHPIPSGATKPFKINNISWLKAPIFQPDTSIYHTDAVIFDTYFEDAAITVDEENGRLILDRFTSYIPEGFADFEVVTLREQPYVIVKYNIDGILYTEWFRFGCESDNPFYRAWKHTARSLETGARQAARGIGFGTEKAIQGAETGIEKAKQGVETGIEQAGKGIQTGAEHAARGIEKGGKQAAQGIESGTKQAADGLEKAWQGMEFGATHAEQSAEFGATHATRGLETGLDGGMTGIGKAVFNESKMFYRPSRIMEDMHPLVYEEKAIEVEKGVTIYTYFFKSRSPKANIFLIHGNGGNVSTYKEMISTLISGNYNVYAVDWRGYGKSTGKPEYKGVLKDTEAAYDDFLSQTQSDALKTLVYGMSLGGQIATKLVRDRQASVDALILDGSISSAQNMAMDFMPGEFIRNNVQKNADMFNQEYVAETDIQHIEKLPKLIIHSKTDEVVTFAHGKKLYENARKPKRFWKTNTRHIRTLEELPDEAIRRIDSLLDMMQK